MVERLISAAPTPMTDQVKFSFPKKTSDLDSVWPNPLGSLRCRPARPSHIEDAAAEGTTVRSPDNQDCRDAPHRKSPIRSGFALPDNYTKVFKTLEGVLENEVLAFFQALLFQRIFELFDGTERSMQGEID